uniref:Uncharacterized protein n=1 Tax=Timema tahoe TaxID=61484 RepID=A0A7R9IBU6_9NEOP|nr:unnamed protein product [Timema tahoe]
MDSRRSRSNRLYSLSPSVHLARLYTLVTHMTKQREWRCAGGHEGITLGGVMDWGFSSSFPESRLLFLLPLLLVLIMAVGLDEVNHGLARWLIGIQTDLGAHTTFSDTRTVPYRPPISSHPLLLGRIISFLMSRSLSTASYDPGLPTRQTIKHLKLGSQS